MCDFHFVDFRIFNNKNRQAGAELCQAQDKLSWAVLVWSNKLCGVKKNFFGQIVRIKIACQISASLEDCKLCLDTFPVVVVVGWLGCEEQ